MVSELGLQLPQLLLGEGCPLLPGLAAAFRLPSVLLIVWGEGAPKQEDVSGGGSAGQPSLEDAEKEATVFLHSF